MFSGLWAPLAVGLVYLARGTFSTDPKEAGVPFQEISTFAVAYMALGVLHRLSSTYTVLATPILRDEKRANPKRYLYVPLAIALACLVLGQGFAFHSVFSFMPTAHGQLWAFFVLAYVMILWERWHFCMQEFGVLSIYRTRARQFAANDRTFDRGYTITLMLFVNMTLFVCLGFSDERDVLLYGTPLAIYQGKPLEQIALMACVVGITSMLVALVREWRHPQRSLPKMLFYFLIGAHTPILYVFPGAMGLFFFTYIFHHWMVAVGLFNRVTLNSYAGQRLPGMRYLTRVGPVFAFCVVWYLFFQSLDRAAQLAPVPNTMMFYGISAPVKFVSGLVIGCFFAFNYLHYYYDRCLYSFGNPAIRKSVGPLVFGFDTEGTVTVAAKTLPVREREPSAVSG